MDFPSTFRSTASIQRLTNLFILPALLSTFALGTGCGGEADNGDGSNGGYTAVVSGEGFETMKAEGSAVISPDLQFQGSTYILLGDQDNEEGGRFVTGFGKDCPFAAGTYGFSEFATEDSIVRHGEVGFEHAGVYYRVNIKGEPEAMAATCSCG